MDYKKLKAFLKAEQKDVDAGKGASSMPRFALTGNGQHTLLIGTGSAFYVLWDHERSSIGYEGEVVEDSRMADYFTKKEAVEPITQLTLTMHLYKVMQYKGPAYLYQKLTYELEGEKKNVWVDSRYLDILDPDTDNLRNLTGVWKFELVEKNLVRVKRSNSHFEVGKGQVTYWSTVMYSSTANLQNYKFDELRKEEEEGVSA